MYFTSSELSCDNYFWGVYWSLAEVVRANESVNPAKEQKSAKTKSPCITMGFCFLGGNILVSPVQSKRAVMPCD